MVSRLAEWCKGLPLGCFVITFNVLRTYGAKVEGQNFEFSSTPLS